MRSKELSSPFFSAAARSSGRRAVLLALGLAATAPIPLAAAPDEIAAQIAGRVLFVPVFLNGRGPYQFIVDTGATETIVTPATAGDAGVAIQPAPGAQKKGIAKTLATGGVRVIDLPVYIFDPPQALSLRLDEGINYGGILGYTFLCRFVTTIDYPRRIVRFRTPDATDVSTPVTNGFSVPFRLVERLIHVRGSVNRTQPATFLLDTGSAETLIAPSLAAQLKLVGTAMSSDPGARSITLEQVAVGDATVPQVSAIIHRPPGERIAGATYDGIVGYPFLRNFAVTIRYDKATILLETTAR